MLGEKTMDQIRSPCFVENEEGIVEFGANEAKHFKHSQQLILKPVDRFKKLP